MSGKGRHLREFDRFRIDLEKKVLWFEDEPVHLPAKAVELLCVLVENRGEIVTKNELLDTVWRDAFVEESVLAQNIHHLRKIFKDSKPGDNPIQTIPRRGYRFAGDVRDIEDEFLVEREVVERALVAEISEDSLNDLDFNGVRRFPSAASSPNKYRLVFACAVTLAVFLFSGWLLWRLDERREKADLKNIRSLAVLPLKNLNENDPSQTFSLGLTDSLISRLGALNRFAVRPFSAVEKYEKSGRDAIGFGRELKTDAVLEGTIQKVAGRLRVNLRLIDVNSGEQMWADSFDETEADMLKLQDTLSNRVADFLLDKFEPEEALLLARRPTANAEAYRLYLIGRERWFRRDGKFESVAFYRKALELDPTALIIMADIAELYYFQRDYERAENELNKVLQIDPNNLRAREYLIKVRFKKGNSYFLESAVYHIFANEISKSENLPFYDLTETERHLANKDEKAIKQAEETLNLKMARENPNGYWGLSRHFSILGEKEKALDALERACEARAFLTPFVAVDPLWDTVRAEPRFQNVLRKMKLL